MNYKTIRQQYVNHDTESINEITYSNRKESQFRGQREIEIKQSI